MEEFPTATSHQITTGELGKPVTGEDWSLDEMETVGLESESAEIAKESVVVLDMFSFEHEAEVTERVSKTEVSLLQPVESQPQQSLQDYFQDAPGVDFNRLATATTAATTAEPNVTGFFDTLSLTERQDSAMLASYYHESSSEAELFNPSTAEEAPDGDAMSPSANFETNATDNPTWGFLPSEVHDEVTDGTRDDTIAVSESDLPSDESRKPTISTAAPTRDLSQFFVEEKFGSDRAGKAFFDALAMSADATGQLLSGVGSGDDPFAALRLSSGESDYHDTWIPRSETKAALMNVVTAPPGTYFPERDQLTMPGVIMTEDLKDPVRDLTLQYLGIEAATQRLTLTADSVSQDAEGLLKLVSVGCYRAAVNLTTRLLVLHNQGLKRAGHPSRHSPQSLHIWMVRLALLAKLHLFNMAEAESAAFGDLDKPDLYYEFYPDTFGKRRGSMVPFAMRILLAQIATCVGKFGEALDHLYRVLNCVTKILNNLKSETCDKTGESAQSSQTEASLSLWKRRELKVLYTIVNCLVAQSDFSSAFSVLDTVLEKDPKSAAHVRSAQGHVLLQLGDVKAAQQSFKLAAALQEDTETGQVSKLINRGLIAVASNNFNEACNVFREAQTLAPGNPVIINNMAVCLLYCGKLREAFRLLEDAITADPKGFVHECLLVNICTLYDLESSRSLQKKSAMLEVVGRYAGDGFNVFCLKLQTPS